MTAEKTESRRRNNAGRGTIIRTDELKPGMVLAEDLAHFNGRVILDKGRVLGAKELRIIKMWGITEAHIIKEDTGESTTGADDSPPAEVLERLEPFVKEHFRFTDMAHDVNRELYRLCLHHYAFSTERWVLAATFPKPRDEDSQADHSLSSGSITSPQEILQQVRYPSLPTVVTRLNEAINHPRCTATHIADIISKDVSLTARLLKLVNSPLYNFPSEITSIPRAVTIVGSRQLTMLALATVVTSTFKDIPPEYLNMESFWKHSIASGILARILAGYRQDTNTEIYFLAGLLHDIGRLIIYQYYPAHAREILACAAEEPEMVHNLEKEILGVDHSTLGGLLMKQWQLANAFENVCRHHHHPLDSPDPMLASVVHLADIIATAMYFGNNGEYYVPPILPGAWEKMNLSVSILAPAVNQASQLLNTLVEFYLPRGPHRKRHFSRRAP